MPRRPLILLARKPAKAEFSKSARLCHLPLGWTVSQAYCRQVRLVHLISPDALELSRRWRAGIRFRAAFLFLRDRVFLAGVGAAVEEVAAAEATFSSSAASSGGGGGGDERSTSSLVRYPFRLL